MDGWSTCTPAEWRKGWIQEINCKSLKIALIRRWVNYKINASTSVLFLVIELNMFSEKIVVIEVDPVKTKKKWDNPYYSKKIIKILREILKNTR